MMIKKIFLRWPVRQIEPKVLEMEMGTGEPLFKLNLVEADKLKLTDSEKDEASYAANDAAINALLIITH